MRSVLSILEEMLSMKPDNGKLYAFLMSKDIWDRLLQEDPQISDFKGMKVFYHEAIEEDTIRMVTEESLSEIQMFLNGMFK